LFGAGLIVLAAAVALVTGLFLAACGADSSEPAPARSTTTAVPPDTATTTTIAELTAVDLATSISGAWAEAMQRLVALLREKPEASTVQADVADLKEEYIQRLVEFGRERLQLSPSDQAQVDSLVSQALLGMASERWYTDYTALYQHYSTGDLEFANLVAGFNILTQYAFFEVLKVQAPEEAARLGIE
jgi:hypothetical protein